ncbi:hypothetical protein PG999_001970 [Apiospora kogelbergensis]|uniref:Rhodopsin domain-containing protein n=1 Tax=Apiospora kogelbergensis TaxID=1337665 RepID=A0AAW0R746_9PEZI
MAIFTTLLALVSVILRDMVPLKTRQNPDRADGLANLAMVLALVELGLTMSASLNGLNQLPSRPLATQEQRKSSGESEYPFPVHYAILSSHFYLLASMTAKAAGCLMCLEMMTRRDANGNLNLPPSSSLWDKITTSTWYRRGYWAILIATVVISFMTLALTTTATRARIGPEAGDKVIVVALRVHGAWAALSDLALALFPSLLLHRLAMLTKKRAALWGIMGLGLVVTACAVVKCVHGDNLYKTILWGTLEQNLGITALNLPTYSPLAATVSRGLTTITTIPKTKAPNTSGPGDHGGEDIIFMDSLSNMHGRQKGPSQRAQITIRSSPNAAVGGEGEDGEDGNNKEKKTNIFLHALERLRRKDHSSPPPGNGEINHISTGSQRNLIWCSSDGSAADRKSEKGDTESARSQEGNIPRSQWTENGIMKTVSIRVNSGENFDVEPWDDICTRKR